MVGKYGLKVKREREAHLNSYSRLQTSNIKVKLEVKVEKEFKRIFI